MGFQVDLVGSVFAEVVPNSDKVHSPGSQRIPAVQQVHPVDPALDPFIDQPMLKAMIHIPVPLKVIMQRKNLTTDLVQVFNPYVLLEIKISDLDPVHFGKKRELAVRVCAVLLIQQQTLESLNEAGLFAGQDEGEVGDWGLICYEAVFF